jgi:hypothetical protein
MTSTLATVPTGPDEAEGPPPTNFYELRDNLGQSVITTLKTVPESWELGVTK